MRLGQSRLNHTFRLLQALREVATHSVMSLPGLLLHSRLQEGRHAHVCCKMCLMTLVCTRMLLKYTIKTKACEQALSSVGSASVSQHQCRMLL